MGRKTVRFLSPVLQFVSSPSLFFRKLLKTLISLIRKIQIRIVIYSDNLLIMGKIMGEVFWEGS